MLSDGLEDLCHKESTRVEDSAGGDGRTELSRVASEYEPEIDVLGINSQGWGDGPFLARHTYGAN